MQQDLKLLFLKQKIRKLDKILLQNIMVKLSCETARQWIQQSYKMCKKYSEKLYVHMAYKLSDNTSCQS